LVFDGGDPEAKQVGAPALDDFIGYRALPRDLDMGWPFSSRVQPCVTTLRKGALCLNAGGDEKRAVEPAAILVGAFEINVGRTPVLSRLD